jgi:hypothetical protein
MVTNLKRTSLLFSTLAALLASSTIVQADVLETTVALPPPNGTYDLSGSPCLMSIEKCLEGATVDDFTNPVITQIGPGGANEQVVVDAGYSADVYNEMTHALIGPVNLDGTVTFVYEGRNPSVNPLGTFQTDVTSFLFTGMFNGKMFELENNPNKSSGGTTSIGPEMPFNLNNPMYEVSSTLTLWGEYSIAGSPFMIPPHGGGASTTLVGTPEPGYMAVAGTLLIGLLGAGLRRSRG